MKTFIYEWLKTITNEYCKKTFLKFGAEIRKVYRKTSHHSTWKVLALF